jgi:hypothetical protein
VKLALSLGQMTWMSLGIGCCTKGYFGEGQSISGPAGSGMSSLAVAGNAADRYLLNQRRVFGKYRRLTGPAEIRLRTRRRADRSSVIDETF